jgi:hypothetical protein
MAFLPGLAEEIDRLERWIVGPLNGDSTRVLQLALSPYRVAVARYSVRREIRRALRQKAQQSDAALMAQHAPRIAEAARRYAWRRFDATRRAAEFKTYARLFSYWHVLHLPLFVLLLVAGIVHVIAINVY